MSPSFALFYFHVLFRIRKTHFCLFYMAAIFFLFQTTSLINCQFLAIYYGMIGIFTGLVSVNAFNHFAINEGCAFF